MSSKETKPVRLSAIDEDILTLLEGRRLYGLQILEEINLGRPSVLGMGTLYPSLNRLEDKGCVSWRWGDDQLGTGGARRKYYEVTELGVAALRTVQQYRVLLIERTKTHL